MIQYILNHVKGLALQQEYKTRRSLMPVVGFIAYKLLPFIDISISYCVIARQSGIPLFCKLLTNR